MREQELIGTMTFGYAQIRRQVALKRQSQHLAPGILSGLFGQEGLILDQAAATIGQLPIWDIIEQEMKCRVRLTERMRMKRGNILGSVYCPPAQIVRERHHKQIQNGFREYTKNTRWQNLVVQQHGFLWVRVLIPMQIISGMDLT